jgi:hypothetical protein
MILLKKRYGHRRTRHNSADAFDRGSQIERNERFVLNDQHAPTA